MKKLTLFLSLMISLHAFSQCVINGKSSLKISESETYSVENDNAQCRDCHLWTSVGGNLELQGDPRKNSIKIKSISGGKSVLTLTMLSAQGAVQCSKNIDILDAAMVDTGKQELPTTTTTSNCDIEFNDYKEAKTADGTVVFLPDSKNSNYKYDWSLTFENGEVKASTEKNPQFNFAKDNGIKTVVLKITSPSCIRNFTKTYEPFFWKFY